MPRGRCLHAHRSMLVAAQVEPVHEPAQNQGVADCGKYDTAHYPGGNSLFPREWTNGMSYPDLLESAELQGSSASDRQQPILTRSPVGRFMPFTASTVLQERCRPGARACRVRRRRSDPEQETQRTTAPTAPAICAPARTIPVPCVESHRGPAQARRTSGPTVRIAGEAALLAR